MVTKSDPDVEVSKAYFPQEGNIQIHQSHVLPAFPVDIIGMELAGRVLGALLRITQSPRMFQTLLLKMVTQPTN